MHRNLVQYKDRLHEIGLNTEIQAAKTISEYVRELFEHFCDNKSRRYIDLSCIMLELDTMDPSLRDIFFDDYQINIVHVAAIFPNAKEIKNPNDEWIALPSLDSLDTTAATMQETVDSKMKRA
eukprot:226029_1